MARVMSAFVAFVVAEYAVVIGMLVYAYGHGGATAAGLVAFAQLAPGIVLAPVLSAVADRRSPTQLLAGGYLMQALGLAGVAVSLWAGAPPLLAYGLAVLASTAMCTTRPALFAVLPALARDAQQLTAATVVAGWAENLGVVLSALVASLFLGLGQLGTLFAVCAVLVAGGALLGAPVRVTGMALTDADCPPSRVTTLLAGAREVAGQPRPRLLVSLLTAQYVVVGSLDVLFVVVAIQVLDRGQVWVGYLNTAYGIGAVAAGLLTAHLLGRRLGRALLTSLLALSLGLILTGFTSAAGPVVTLVAVAGGGRAVLAVSANTLLQRVVPAQLVGRVFGIVEGLSGAGLAAGSLLTPLLVGIGGGGGRAG